MASKRTTDDVIYNIDEAVQVLAGEETIAFDLETTGLDAWRSNIALMQFYGKKQMRPCLIRIRDGVIPDKVREIFAPGKLFVGHNISGFDCLFLDTHGIPWKRSEWYDTLIGEGIISTTGRRDVSKSLKKSVRRRLGLEIDKNIEHGNWGIDSLSEEQVLYAVEDVAHLIDLMDEQVSKADTQGQLPALEMEMELAPVTTQMTLNGLPIVPEVLNQWLDSQRELMAESEAWLRQNLGPINLNSHVQIRKAVSALGAEWPNTKAETLDEIARYGDGIGVAVARNLLDYRGPAQRLRMYQDSWQRQHIIDGWVHPRFWQVGTDTMRYSSSDPNLQQVPKDGRQIVGNMDGLTIVSADYSQIEVRIAAELANDTVLKELLLKDDVHTAVASKIYGVPEADVSSAMRRNAKATTFLLLFGGGHPLLYQNARATGNPMTEDEAYDIFTKFFGTFEGLARIRRQAYGMRDRRVVKIILPNLGQRLLVGRNVTPTRILNTPVQGSAGVGLKYAMLGCREAGLDKYLGATVHDELVAAVPDREARDYGEALAEQMVKGMNRAFPNMFVKVEVKYGKCWQA